MDNMTDKLIIGAFPKIDYDTAEAMNTLWTNLSYTGTDVKSIAFTSCRPNEGKSLLVMSLAQTITGTGKRVLVIDADLRKSVITGRYRINSMTGEIQGLAHYLSGQCNMDDIMYETDKQNLSMVLAGHEAVHSFALLDSTLFPALMQSVRSEYDVILVDTPPVGTIIDAAIISRSCDGVVVIVKENLVSRRELAEARGQIEKVGGRVLGAVLNDVTFGRFGIKKHYYKAYHKYDGFNNDYREAGNDKRQAAKQH